MPQICSANFKAVKKLFATYFEQRQVEYKRRIWYTRNGSKTPWKPKRMLETPTAASWNYAKFVLKVLCDCVQ
jgi:hypothetical protein